MFKPTHLSLFAISRANGQPIAGAPFYAEIVAPMVIDEPPTEVDHRFDDFILQELAQVDSLCSDDEACRKRVMAAIQQALSRLLTGDTRDRLSQNSDIARSFIQGIIRQAEQAGGGSLKNLTDGVLRDAIDKALRDVAARSQLTLAPETVTTAEKAKTAYPLGILATNHVGYLSFDLTRLPTDVYDSLVKALDVRRSDSNATLDVSVWFYALAREDLRFDALVQGRFSEDAIITKLEFEELQLPPIAKAVGFLSMQNPSLTDWRLSPASFAANPSALIGDEEGCETLLPAHVALQEFYFYQVVRLNDMQQQVPTNLQDKVRVGVIHEYRLAWYPLGHSLGQIIYSLPLAPGESVNLAVIDWTRRDDAQRAEHTTVDEQLVHNEHRDRTITETVNAAVGEYQHGSSFMGGLAESVGVSAALSSGVGLAAGLAGSLGGSTASSSGSRNLAATTVQNLSDNITQVSASMRELQSTVVVHSVQAEKEAIETRTVVNYNHSHALTILYYEVLRHFRVVTERVRSSAALLVHYDQDPFSVTIDQHPFPGVDIHFRTYTSFLRDNRSLLKAGLLDQQYAAGFDAVERIEERGNEATHAPALAPANAGDEQFVYFTILIHTGGYSNSSAALRGILYDGPNPLTDLVRTDLSGPGDDFALQSFGSFADTDHDYISYAVTKDKLPRKWSEVRAILLRFGGVGDGDKRLGIKKITVTGSDMSGVTETLIDWSGDYIFTNNTDLLLETKHPAPPPASPAPSADEIKDRTLVDALLDHLEHNKEYYLRLIWLNEDPLARASRFDGMTWDGSSTLLDHLENRAVEIIGPWVAFPAVDKKINDEVIQALEAADLQDVERSTPFLNERLVTLPTRGVFAEAKLGHCNASEEIDNTRFWDWQQSPIPHLAPEIAPVTPVTPQPQQPNLAPTPFPQSLVNIVNPPAAPDPTGLAAAFNVLATPNIFRDMSGQAEVADLLKKLSDNSISIAEAANQARSIQAKYGSPSAPGAIGLGGIGNTGGFGSRATPTQPSAATRDLQDLRNELGQGVASNMTSPDKARSIYETAADRMTSGPMLGFALDAGTADGGTTSTLNPGNFKPFVDAGKLDLELADVLRALDENYPADSWAKQTAAFAYHELQVGNLLAMVKEANREKARAQLPSGFTSRADVAVNGNAVTVEDVGGTGAYKGFTLIANDLVTRGMAPGPDREFLALVITHELTHFRNRDYRHEFLSKSPSALPDFYVDVTKATSYTTPTSKPTQQVADYVIWEVMCNHVSWHVQQDLRQRSAGTPVRDNPSKKGFFRYALALDGRGWPDNDDHSGYLADLKTAGKYNEQIALWLQKAAPHALFHDDPTKNQAVRQFIQDMYDAVKPDFQTPTEPADGGV